MSYNPHDDKFTASPSSLEQMNQQQARLANAKMAMTVAWKKAEATGALGSFSMKTLHDYYTALPEVQEYLIYATHVTTAKWIITKHLNELISSYVQSLPITGFEQRVAAENRSGS
jgi:hypothetical protein